MFKKLFHGKPKSNKDMLGVSKDDSLLAETREKIYQDFFGPSDLVSHEVVPLVPHIDVWVHPPGYKEREFFTIVTSGMSDVPMNLEKGIPRSFARREMIMYAADHQEIYINLVRQFARFPFEYSTWLGVGHTIPNGNPPSPIFQDSELVAIVFLPAMVEPDRALADKLAIDGEPVEFLWPVPITQTELEFKLERGVEELAGLLMGMKSWPAVDPKRKSLV